MNNPDLPAALGITWGQPVEFRPIVQESALFSHAYFSGRLCRGSGCGAEDGPLARTVLTLGRAITGVPGCPEAVDTVRYYAGSSIEPQAVPSDPMLDVARFPDCSFDLGCYPLRGEVAGTARYVGLGRVFASSEAAMFSASCRGSAPCPCVDPGCDDEKVGMQPVLGYDNQTYLLNIVHWLEGLLPLTCPGLTICDEGCVPTEDCTTYDLCQDRCWDPAAPPPAPWVTGCGLPDQTLRLRQCTCECPSGPGGTLDSTLLCL